MSNGRALLIRAWINQYLWEVLSPLDSYTVGFQWLWALFLNVNWQVILGDTYENIFSRINQYFWEVLRPLDSRKGGGYIFYLTFCGDEIRNKLGFFLFLFCF